VKPTISFFGYATFGGRGEHIMRELFERLTSPFRGKSEQSRHKSLLNAAMAACALVAMADDDERLAELAMRDRVLLRLKELEDFNTQKAIDVYDHHVQLIGKNSADGRQAAMDVLSKVRGDRRDSERLVKICVAIGRADHTFSPKERSVVEDICRSLDLHPGDLGVYDL
jgi:tellurite resistance protein TerB